MHRGDLACTLGCLWPNVPQRVGKYIEHVAAVHLARADTPRHLRAEPAKSTVRRQAACATQLHTKGVLSECSLNVQLHCRLGSARRPAAATTRSG